MLGHIKQLCVLSVLCGAAMSLTPEGGVRRVMSILCMLILACSLLTALRSLDFDAYALELARYREQEQRFLTDNSEKNARLNRLVIEQECGTYILDKARSIGLELQSVAVELEWSGEGFWVPRAAQIAYRGEERQRRVMESLIAGDLGIPTERQIWVLNEGD